MLLKRYLFVITLVLVIVFTTFSSVFALTGSSTSFGSLNIDQDQVSISEDALTIIQVTGTVDEYSRGVAIYLEIINPDGTVTEQTTQANNDGTFSIPILLDANWIEGNYEINGIYQGNPIGTVQFSISQIIGPNIPSYSNIGTIEIEETELTISKNNIIVDVSGNIKNYQEDEPITIEITQPDGTLKLFTILAKDNGDYVAHLTITDEWASGNYYILGKYNEAEIGSVTFVLNKLGIPDWIRNNAKWWSEGKIGDSDFIGGIQFMINENIISIPNLPEQITETSEGVPDWVRNNAGWWADGLISDEDFMSGIKYLVEHGIILV